MSETMQEALSNLADYLANIGGCTDGHCIIVRPKGMHTNGGCRCSTDKTKMQRFAYAHNRFVDNIRAIANPTNP